MTSRLRMTKLRSAIYHYDEAEKDAALARKKAHVVPIPPKR
jgi:hypothetical protein